MATMALGLGSNQGNRLLNLRTAVKYLRETRREEGQIEVVRKSDVFETAPWGVTDQPHFLNACLLAESDLPPESLLELLKGIEARMGRTTTRRWGERLIDLDILLIDSLLYDSPMLHIPHSDMHRRDFVLIPLAQILPDWIHPGTERSVASMATNYHGAVRICGL